MGNKLEQLLNSLIEKGWKPFGRETRHELSSWVVYDTIDIKGKWDIRVIDRWHHHIRELVAKESWLWQFVYDNWYNQEKKEYREWYTKYNMKAEYWDTNDYEYYIIESALCDEDKLEEFLLNSIKLD